MNEYSPAMKKQIKKRDQNMCFFCDAKKNLTIAHIFVPRRDNGIPNLLNGMCICRKCHDKLDFGIGCTIEEQIEMLKICKAYLMLGYNRVITEQELTLQKVKKRCR